MKVAIIGAGNMGGAIARGLAQGNTVKTSDIIVSNPSKGKLDVLKSEFPDILTTTENEVAVREANLVILAVKPWYIEQVLSFIKLDPDTQVLVSVASGISFDRMAQCAGSEITMFRVIPNTAISQLASMTLITSRNASKEQEELIINLFNEMGTTMLLSEDKLDAATSLASCGIAYVFKYIQAGMQAGVEMGIPPKDALKLVAQSAKGAAEILLSCDTHPSIEIDKVTTPGGITIKGINELDHGGFTSAVIKAMKASNPAPASEG